MTYKKEWDEYYKLTKSKPPRPLLLEALTHVRHEGKAIDIGGGALRDAKYLLEQGFEVTVIDKSPLMKKEADALKNKKLHSIVVSFEEFNFPINEYDLASAMYSLPFCKPAYFDIFLEKIKKSLKQEGVLCGQFFGDRDGWATNSAMTFHTKERAVTLLSDMTTISFKEEEKDDRTANGEQKHWHIFNFIVKK